MQGGRNPLFNFGDPFAGFGGFGSFGGQRSLIPNVFGGRDPFDDPFFTRPFGGLFESSSFGPSGSPFGDAHAFGFLEHQPSQPPRTRRGLIIEELNNDDEKEEKESISENKGNPRKHSRSSKEPSVEDPDDEAEERRSKLAHFQNDINQLNEMASQPRGRSFTFQTTSVSYGGANGTYYTSSKMRRTGSDGLTFEESKEADSATRKATHRVARGIYDKGHSVMRELNPDGRVNTMQTLHNLNKDELVGFEEAWKESARQHLPGLSEGHGLMGSGNGVQNGPSRSGGWALPSTERAYHSGGVRQDIRDIAGPSRTQHPGRLKTDVGDGVGSSSGKSRAARRR